MVSESSCRTVAGTSRLGSIVPPRDSILLSALGEELAGLSMTSEPEGRYGASSAAVASAVEDTVVMVAVVPEVRMMRPCCSI